MNTKNATNHDIHRKCVLHLDIIKSTALAVFIVTSLVSERYLILFKENDVHKNSDIKMDTFSQGR